MKRMWSRNELREIIKKRLEDGTLNLNVNAIKSKDTEQYPLTNSGGLTLKEGFYCKCVVKNDILWIIMEGFVDNETESNITNPQFVFDTSSMSEYVASKVLREDGTTLVDNPASLSNIRVCNSPIIIAFNNGRGELNSGASKELKFLLNFTFTPNTERNVSVRVPLLLE